MQWNLSGDPSGGGGGLGKLFNWMDSVPSPNNPKTSYMAALSAIALLWRITAPLVLGT